MASRHEPAPGVIDVCGRAKRTAALSREEANVAKRRARQAPESESSPPWLVEVLDRARTAHVVLDPAGRILWVNPATARMAGGDARDLIGWDATVLMPLDVAGEVRARMAALLEHGSFEYDVVHVRADGRRGYSRIRSEVVPEEDGSPRWILVEVQDLSDLQDQLERLSQTALSLAADSGEELLTTILRAARTLTGARYAALGIADDDGRLVRFIPDGMTDKVIAGIDHWPDGRGLLGAMIAERRTINVPTITADPRSGGFPAGHPPMSSFLGVPIVAGDVVHGHLYLTDKQGTEPFNPIDERLAELFAAHAAAAIHNGRRREKLTANLAALRESESGLRFQATILDNVHDGVIVLGMDGRIAYWNRGAEAVFGYSAAEMLGETPDILHPDTGSAQVAAGLGRIARGEDFAGECQGRRKDGSSAWVELRTTVMRDGAGEPLGFISVARDVGPQARRG